MPYTETELLLLISKGDKEAFGLLYDQYRNKVFGYIFSLVRSQELVEDIFQDVFTKVWEQRASLTRVDNFNAYLYKVIRNRSFDGLRRVAKEHEIIVEILSRTRPSASTTEEMLQYQEMQKRLHMAVGKLPAQQRQVYLLGKEDGLKHDEIAAVLNIAVTTVNKHMTRALGFLRKNLSVLLLFVK